MEHINEGFFNGNLDSKNQIIQKEQKNKGLLDIYLSKLEIMQMEHSYNPSISDFTSWVVVNIGPFNFLLYVWTYKEEILVSKIMDDHLDACSAFEAQVFKESKKLSDYIYNNIAIIYQRSFWDQNEFFDEIYKKKVSFKPQDLSAMLLDEKQTYMSCMEYTLTLDGPMGNISVKYSDFLRIGMNGDFFNIVAGALLMSINKAADSHIHLDTLYDSCRQNRSTNFVAEGFFGNNGRRISNIAKTLSIKETTRMGASAKVKWYKQTNVRNCDIINCLETWILFTMNGASYMMYYFANGWYKEMPKLENIYAAKIEERNFVLCNNTEINAMLEADAIIDIMYELHGQHIFTDKTSFDNAYRNTDITTCDLMNTLFEPGVYGFGEEYEISLAGPITLDHETCDCDLSETNFFETCGYDTIMRVLSGFMLLTINKEAGTKLVGQ